MFFFANSATGMPLLRSASSFFRNAINSAPDLRMRLFDFVLDVLIEEG